MRRLLLFYCSTKCAAKLYILSSIIYGHAHAGTRSIRSLVPRPSAPRPVGKLEREKGEEGLVNGHTSSAGMLAELIKT